MKDYMQITQQEKSFERIKREALEAFSSIKAGVEKKDVKTKGAQVR